MQDSQVVLGWMADAGRKAEVNALRGTLLRRAQKRFEGELKEEDEQVTSTQDSGDVWREWLDAVVEQPTCADFRAVLRR